MAIAPAMPFCLPSMFLFVKIRMISGRKAITVMIAPSWFWMKNRTLSDFRAGSRRLARFQSSEPPTASAPMTTSRMISSTRLTGSWRSTKKIANASVPIARIHRIAAMTRKVVAFPFDSGVGFQSAAASSTSAASRLDADDLLLPVLGHGFPPWLIC